MTWLVTQELGTDDEFAYELTDDELVDTIHIMIRDKEAAPDGTSLLIRRADYLEVSPRRPNLKLIQGGKK